MKLKPRDSAATAGGQAGRDAGIDLDKPIFTLMSEAGKPIVGRINGHALAGGLGLACACDLLVAVDTATFGTPEINVGIIEAPEGLKNLDVTLLDV